ncbi:MAG: hypothetical protein AB7E68_01995 [Candidatus Babeliales bacterium]
MKSKFIITLIIQILFVAHLSASLQDDIQKINASLNPQEATTRYEALKKNYTEIKDQIALKEAYEKKVQELQSTFLKSIKIIPHKFTETINRAKELMAHNYLVAPTISQKDYVQTIIDLMKTLYIEKGQEFKQGTLIIEESADQPIYNFLKDYVRSVYDGDMNTELWFVKGSAYPFASGRFNEYYAAKGFVTPGRFFGYTKKPEYTHYKIDFDTNNALIFGNVDRTKNLFFIHMQGFPLNGETPLHNREEYVPEKALELFSKFTIDTEKLNKARGLGLSYMWQQVENIPYEVQQISNPALALKELLEKKYNNNLDIRIGNEIIIRKEELPTTFAIPTLKTLFTVVKDQLEAINKKILREQTQQPLLSEEALNKELETLFKNAQKELQEIQQPELRSALRTILEKTIEYIKDTIDSLPNILILISDKNDEEFYQDYQKSLNHLKQKGLDINTIYEKIGLESAKRYEYTPLQIATICDSFKLEPDSDEYKKIRQIKFTLRNQASKKAYDAYLGGKEELAKLRISTQEAEELELDYQALNSTLTTIKYYLEQLLKQISN